MHRSDWHRDGERRGGMVPWTSSAPRARYFTECIMLTVKFIFHYTKAIADGTQKTCLKRVRLEVSKIQK